MAGRRAGLRRGRRRLAVALGLLLSGCGALSDSEITVETIDSWTAVGRSPETQIALIREPEVRALLCMAPAPDAVSIFAEGLTVSASVGNGTDRVGEHAAHGAVALGGRNPHVLLAREIFFRACELVMNHRLDRDDALALYREGLATVAPAFAAGGAGSATAVGGGGSGAAGGEDDSGDSDDDDARGSAAKTAGNDAG